MGNIDEVFELLQLHAPTVLAKPGVLVRLRCFQFLGLVKKEALVDAVQFSRTHLAPFHNTEWRSMLVAAMGALASPVNSAAAPCIEGAIAKVGLTPEEVSLWVNRALLESEGVPACSTLETLISQLKVLHHTATEHLPAYQSLGPLEL